MGHSFASRRRFCAIAASRNSSLEPLGLRSLRREDTFAVGEQHLDLLAMMTGALESECAGRGTGNIASILIQIARHPAC